MQYQLPLLLGFLLFGNWAFAQTDDCMAAPELVVVNDCLRKPGNTKGLRENAKVNSCGGNADDDGWFKFTAISERTQISVSTDQLTDMVVGVYQNCAIELGCVNEKGIGGQEILRLDTKIDDVYYIQIYEAGDGGAEFLICVSALDAVECLDPIMASFDIQSPNCADPTSGSIEINLMNGVITPYTFQLNEEESQTNPLFANLTAGEYAITIKNTLYCQLDTILTLSDEVSLTLNIGDDLLVNQDKIVNLEALTNVPITAIDAIIWTGIALNDCSQPCLNPSFTATTSTTIQATLTTLDGCQIRDELLLSLPEKTDIFIPNIFSPNGDGINDFFTVYASAGITNILSLQVADRWGNLVFQANNFAPNQTSLGWDGRLKNQVLSSQTFIYFVEIEMPDKTTKILSGELFLVL